MPSTATSLIDGVTTSVAVKSPCVAVAVTNITLAGLQTVSGVVLAEGDRVLCVSQTSSVNNGIYIASTGTWTRSPDADGNRDLVQGTRVLVRSSTAVAVEYELVSVNPIVIGTSSLVFTLRYGANATYDLNAIEVLLGLTIVNDQYPPGDVDRYKLNAISGTTVMNTAFQAAFDLAKASGCDVTYGRTWPYLLTAPIDAGCDSGDDLFVFNVRNIGQLANHSDNPPAYACILLNHTGHGFDCSGSPGIVWHEPSIGTYFGSASPKTAIFLSRNTAGSSSYHGMIRPRFYGTFSVAALYNYGAEEMHVDTPIFIVAAGAVSGTKCVWITSQNIKAQTSTFRTLPPAPPGSSTRCHVFTGGSYYNFNLDNTADCIGLDTAADVVFNAPFFLCKGRSFVHVDPTNGACDRVSINDINSEPSVPQATYGIDFAAAGSTTQHTYFKFNGYLVTATRAVYSGLNVVLSSFDIGKISESSSRGIEVLNRIQQSNIQAGILVVNVSRANNITGDPVNYTITTRERDVWNDTSGTKSFTIGTAALTVTGALTKRARFEHQHGQVAINAVMQAVTSIVCAQGIKLTGLPAIPNDYSADVQVTNLATGVVIGGGYVNPSDSSIVLPAINVGANVAICITARYFAAGV